MVHPVVGPVLQSLQRTIAGKGPLLQHRLARPAGLVNRNVMKSAPNVVFVKESGQGVSTVSHCQQSESSR